MHSRLSVKGAWPAKEWDDEGGGKAGGGYPNCAGQVGGCRMVARKMYVKPNEGAWLYVQGRVV